jgi:hypothetical protein
MAARRACGHLCPPARGPARTGQGRCRPRRLLENDRYDASPSPPWPTTRKPCAPCWRWAPAPKLVTSRYDGTALIAAAHLGHDGVVRQLIAAGAPLDHVNNLHWTAVIESIVLGNGGPRHQATLQGADRRPAPGRPATGRPPGPTPLQLALEPEPYLRISFNVGPSYSFDASGPGTHASFAMRHHALDGDPAGHRGGPQHGHAAPDRAARSSRRGWPRFAFPPTCWPTAPSRWACRLSAPSCATRWSLATRSCACCRRRCTPTCAKATPMALAPPNGWPWPW